MKKFKILTGKNRINLTKSLKTITPVLFLLAFSGAAWIPCYGQAASPPLNYICYQPDQQMVIDGKLDEKSWQYAAWTSTFTDIEGAKKPAPLQQTKVKMLWDKEYLYIAAVLEEEHIWAYQNKKDQIVFLENDFEVFIDPDGDTNNYYELEINALNNTFDLFLPKPYRHGGKPDIGWNIEGLKSAVSLEGTINESRDKDKQWTLEIAVPFASLKHHDVEAIIPEDKDTWRINFSRVNWQHELDSQGKYSRRKNPETGKVMPEYNWVWSPQGIINMHFPEYWGLLQFSKQKSKP